MRLDFNVLWVEDQEAVVQSTQEAIERRLRAEGFQLVPQFAASVEDAGKMLAEDVYADGVDLVLMDLDLGAGPSGTDGLLTVRRVLPYRDIVFYSAHSQPKLQEEVTRVGAQGVFVSSRMDLPDSVFGVFEALTKKVLDIDHSRGVVLGATAEIDELIARCLAAAVRQDGPRSERMIMAVASRVEHMRENMEGLSTKAGLLKIGEDAVALHLGAADNLIVLRKTLTGEDALKKHCEAMKTYQERVVPRRNDLAHVTLKRGHGFSRTLENRRGETLTAVDLRELRKELLDYRDSFGTLQELLEND